MNGPRMIAFCCVLTLFSHAPAVAGAMMEGVWETLEPGLSLAALPYAYGISAGQRQDYPL